MCAWKTRIPYRLIDFSTRMHPISNKVIGIKRLSDVGGTGSWTWIDEFDNPVEPEQGYFSKHPTFQFKDVNLDGNEMVAVPKFYVKSDGNSRYWISPVKREGFHVHPAFMSKGMPITDLVTGINNVTTDQACIYIGKWQSWIDFTCILDDKVKMWSIPSWTEAKIEEFVRQRNADTVKYPDGYAIDPKDRNSLLAVYPTVESTWWQNWHAADNWNSHSEDGVITVSGYHMMNVWEWSALQWLAMIEACGTDVQSRFGLGHVDGAAVDVVDGADRSKVDKKGIGTKSSDFHGIYGLWGNVWQWIQGIQTTYDGAVWIWDNIGNSLYKNTGYKMKMRQTDREEWSPGETYGWWRSRIIASGWNYDTSDLFIPDTDSLASDYDYGAFSDGVWCRTKTRNDQLCAVAVGGPFNSGKWGGMFAWNFNLRKANENEVDGIRKEDSVWIYSNVASRLCFAPVNLPGLAGAETDEEPSSEDVAG